MFDIAQFSAGAGEDWKRRLQKGFETDNLLPAQQLHVDLLLQVIQIVQKNRFCP